MFITSAVVSVLLSHSDLVLAAKYDVKEITPLAQFKHHYATGINDSGEVVGIARTLQSFPIYNESYLETLFKSFCDISDSELASGDFDLNTMACLGSSTSAGFLNASTKINPQYQKIAEVKSYLYKDTSTSLTFLTDFVDNELGDYTYSNDEQLFAINNSGIAVGTAASPFTPVDFTYTTPENVSTELKFWQSDYKSRAVIHLNGEVITIEPTFSMYGGQTTAVDISNSGYIAGASSVELLPGVETSINTDCTGVALPVLVCTWSKQPDATNTLFISRPYIWQIDDAGVVTSSKEFGLAFTPTESQTGVYSAKITAVNEFGMAVGFGHVHDKDKRITIQPLVFNYDTGTTSSLINNDLYDRGYASDINSSNVVVGKVQTIFDNAYNDEFFVYDMESEELKTPTTFYSSAESTATAINDEGKVIGSAEYEVTTDNVRRRRGFIYDIHTEEFFDINELTSCNSEFEIVEMNSINNKNQIAATAIKQVEAKNSAGEIIYKDNGEVTMEEVLVSVLLTPNPSGEIETCPESDDDKFERKGLSTPPILLLFLSSLLYVRRRFL